MTAGPAAGEAAAQWWPGPADGDQPLDLAEVVQLGRAQFRRALIRRLRVARATEGIDAGADVVAAPLLTEHPEEVADVVMGLANLLVPAKDGEQRRNCEG
jgi:hypothetical protein